MSTQTLQILGSYGLRAKKKYARIVHNYKDGHSTSALVGNSGGTVTYVLNFEFLPDEELTVTNPEAGGATQTWVVYIDDFFSRRMADGAAFNITDPRTGSTVSVKLMSSELDLEYISYKLYGSGLELQQSRAAA